MNRVKEKIVNWDFFNKIVLLYVTGSPGLIKLLIVLFASKLLEAPDSASFSINFSILIALSIFTSIGFSTQIMKVSATSLGPEKEFYPYLLYSVVTSLVILFFFVAISFLSESIEVAWAFFILVISYYNCVKSYYIARRKFYKAAFLEITIILLFIMQIIFFYLFEMISAKYFVTATILSYLAAIVYTPIKKREPSHFCFNNYLIGVKAGFSNLMSSGIVYLLPYFSSIGGSANLVLSITISSYVLGIASVFPRAYLNKNIKIISSSIDQRLKSEISRACLIKAEKKCAKIAFLSAACSFFSSIFLLYLAGGVLTVSACMAVFLGALFMFSAQAFVVSSFVMLVTNKINLAIIVNFLIFVVFIITMYGLRMLGMDGTVAYFCSLALLCVLYFVRGYVFQLGAYGRG